MKKSEKIIERDKRLLLLLGKMCKKIRKEKNLRVSDIAEMSNTSISNVYCFEEGNNNSGKILLAYLKGKIDIKEYLKSKKSKRIKDEITLRQMSIITGYTKAQISHFENGKNDSAILVYFYEVHI